MAVYKDINEVNSDSYDNEAIKNSIRNIILTPRGSLPGKPRFGSDLYKVLFSPMDSLTEAMAKNYINEALSEYEDRVDVNSITFKRVEEYNRLLIDINFSFKNIRYNQDSALDDLITTIAVNL